AWPAAVNRKCWSRLTATPIPRKTPQTKNPMANSLALSHGRRRVRNRTSASSQIVKPTSSSAQRTISTRSRPSSAAHLRCRCALDVMRGLGRRSVSAGASGAATLRDVADELQHLGRLRAQLLGLRRLERRRQGDEALAVDFFVILDAHRLQRLDGGRVVLQRLLRGPRQSVGRGILHPLPLLVVEAVQGLLA